MCLNLRTVCEELTEVVYKWKKIGVQLGVPHYKLMEFKSSDDPLMHLVDYWLKGNVEGVSVSWNSIVKALRSRYVQATGLANKLEKKYCKEDEGENLRFGTLLCMLLVNGFTYYVVSGYSGPDPDPQVTKIRVFRY